MEAWTAKQSSALNTKHNIEASAAGQSLARIGSGKVDTQRLEYFSDIDSLHLLLKHPLLISFLELEMNSLRKWFFLDFFIYLVFVILLFTYLGNRYYHKFILINMISNKIAGKIEYYVQVHLKLSFRYGVFKVGYDDVEDAVVYDDATIKITIPLIILWAYIVLLICREVGQLYKFKKR